MKFAKKKNFLNGISNHKKHFFNISLLTGNLLSREISKTKSVNKLDFFVSRMIYFWNKWPNQIKNNNSVKNLRLNWMISEKKNGKKKNLRTFCNYQMKYLKFDLYIDIVLIMFCVKIIFLIFF